MTGFRAFGGSFPDIVARNSVKWLHLVLRTSASSFDSLPNRELACFTKLPLDYEINSISAFHLGRITIDTAGCDQ
jgi:hypothetical protein